MLPLTEEEVGWTRVWQAILELGRLDDDVASCIDDAVAFERHLVGQAVAQEDVDEVMALIDGLRQAVARKLIPMDTGRAREILGRRLSRAEAMPPDPN